MLNWKPYPYSDLSSTAYLGPLYITCHQGREYKDGTSQYSIWLNVCGSDSRETITVTKIRGTLADAQAEAEKIFNFAKIEEKEKVKALISRNVALAAIEHSMFCDADILTENWDSADDYFMEEFGCTVADVEEALDYKFDVKSKWPYITTSDILSLHPSFFSSEKEVYFITSDSSSFYLEVYINSDFGCEYTLYDEEYNDIDGGVIDECEAENEKACAELIFDLLKDMDVHGTSISKLPEESEEGEHNISFFEKKIEERWRKKVREQKERNEQK